jgi:hypothetical protein
MAKTNGGTVPVLAVPLTEEQMAAASELHQRYLVGWQRYDQVLHALGDHFASNTDLECVLPKAITLNQLYATRILAITRMAVHIVDVLGNEPDPPGLEAVEKIAWLPEAGPKGMRFRSFASKYCHFFVDQTRFPILDEFAGDALTYHLGRRGRSHYRASPFSYLTYVADVNRLRDWAGLSCSYRELDRYLWLRGQWEQWRKPPLKSRGVGSGVNPEVRDLFSSDCPQTKGLLAEAFGSTGVPPFEKGR